MAFILDITDDSDVQEIESSGSIGRGFRNLANESTASLGLTEPLSVLSSSIDAVLNQDATGATDGANHLKFLTAKVYNNREAIGKVWTSTQTFYGNKQFKHPITGSLNGNAATSTTLETARTIGGVSFDGSANINLPGVNADQTNHKLSWAGNAATATSASHASTASLLSTARTIGGVSFDGSANINLPGVNSQGNQNTSGTSEFTNLVNSSTAAAKSGLQFTFDAAAGTLTITDKATRTTLTLRKD